MNIIRGNEIFWSAKIFVEAIEMFETAENLKAENFLDPPSFLSIKNFWREKILSKKKSEIWFWSSKNLRSLFFWSGAGKLFLKWHKFSKAKEKNLEVSIIVPRLSMYQTTKFHLCHKGEPKINPKIFIWYMIYNILFMKCFSSSLASSQ